MGRHVWFRTPTKQDRLDILDLYIGKVAHDADLDQPHKREEIARVTNGYSPAMLEQVTSMALTIAHHSDREAFDLGRPRRGYDHSGGRHRSRHRVRAGGEPAVAIHEAGHAAAGHAYLKGAESTRLSIRMRGGALGHHQALEKEERFSRFQSEKFARLVWGLGAMAAERVFYGENSNGVGGDVMCVHRAGGGHGRRLGDGATAVRGEPREGETPGRGARRILERFEKIGLQIMNRTGGGGPFGENPIASVLVDPDKRTLVGQLLGQAYVAAHNLDPRQPHAVDHIADVLVARRELFGDELLDLLDERQDHDPGRRPLGGELVADDVMGKAAADAQPVADERGGAVTAPVPNRAPTVRGDSSTEAALRRSTCARDGRGSRVGALIVLVGRGTRRPPLPGPSGSRPEARSAEPPRSLTTSSDPYRLPSGKPLVAVHVRGCRRPRSRRTTFQVRAIAR